MLKDVNTKEEAWHNSEQGRNMLKPKQNDKKRKENVSDECKKYLGPIRLKITKETPSYGMQVTYIWNILHWSGSQLDNVTVICIQQCSEILLKLLKALYHYYETLALQHTQQCKYITSSILCKQLHSQRSLLQPGSIYHEISSSPLGNFSVLPLLPPVQSCGSNNADFQPHGTPQPTPLYHTRPLLLPQPGNLLYLMHDHITNLNKIF